MRILRIGCAAGCTCPDPSGGGAGYRPQVTGAAMFFLLSALLTTAHADIPPGPPPTPVGEPAAADALPPELQQLVDLEASLTYEHGPITLAGGKVVLQVPEGFGYLDPEETSRVIAAWGNPPDTSTLGSLFPTGMSPFSPEGWGAILSYVDEGHVSDTDAAEIDYDELLKSMQEDDAAENAERQRLGLAEIHLLGWAAPPRYDAAGHKLHWAKRLGSTETETLNYDIRVLGREGVLSVQAVAMMDQTAAVNAGMEQVLGFASFTQGNRYEDYDASTDRLAEAGIAALILGGTAAAATKGGMFKGLIALLLAGKKLLIPAVVAGFAALKGLFGKKQEPAK